MDSLLQIFCNLIYVFYTLLSLKYTGKKRRIYVLKPFFDDFPIIFCIFMCLNEDADKKGSNYVF